MIRPEQVFFLISVRTADNLSCHDWPAFSTGIISSALAGRAGLSSHPASIGLSIAKQKLTFQESYIITKKPLSILF